MCLCVGVGSVSFQEGLSQEKPLLAKMSWEHTEVGSPHLMQHMNHNAFSWLLPSQFHPAPISDLGHWNLVVGDSSLEKLVWIWGKRQSTRLCRSWVSLSHMEGAIGATNHDWVTRASALSMSLTWSRVMSHKSCPIDTPQICRWWHPRVLFTDCALYESCEFPKFPDPCELPVFLRLKRLPVPSLLSAGNSCTTYLLEWEEARVPDLSVTSC